MLYNKEIIQKGLDELKSEYGEWVFDIPLPFGIWTKGNLQIPQTRLKRIIQIVNDLSDKPLSECRVLDLGCLDGIFSIEFAKHGAETVGVEIREANVKKALFCKEVLGLKNLQFYQDDVRNISTKFYGRFDAIICSGILYHLTATDAINLIKTMFTLVNRIVIIDTHVSLMPQEQFLFEGNEYWGDTYREHPDNATLDQRTKRLLSSLDNLTSFWFTRPSLVNILNHTGFSSIYECFAPVHLMPENQSFENRGITSHDRCTFVAIKNKPCKINTAPVTNNYHQSWSEHSLSYSTPKRLTHNTNPIHRRLLSKLISQIGMSLDKLKS